MRLAKYLAHGGVASRRKAEEIIAKGVVTVGGEVVTDPARDVGDGDDVRVNGAPVGAETREVWAVNKPAGVVSTAREPGERRAVVELVDSQARLYPVGRLDADSTGLLLLTNDGALANRLTHPRYEVAKTYRARLAKPPGERELARLRDGSRAGGRPDRAGAGAPGEAMRRSRSSSAKAATGRCAGWSRRSATGSWRCSGSASGRCARDSREGAAAERGEVELRAGVGD